ncbi:Secretion system C-terminal sorting domain-containing protein [Flavobacterium branchiophilum]|uniref:Secretion system C-terminal sorting domain-containing protein n=1 Tax=Flavobacterium branchiophilum (strain FL-15) TaxID=1034807 RepID=G2Z0J7_FLABF|nr:T9SS type A sorting domain-containing protein [Flavobacterium branchiophilum]CCB69393.1 Protein of unknown function precursor [Flavobacterium branchiophilum FL-15]
MKKITFLSMMLFSALGFSQTLPLDFESSSTTYTFTDFDGGVVTKIANPQSSGINTSATVCKMVKNAGQVWGGSFITLSSTMDFTTTKLFKLKVYSPRTGAKLLLKVENPASTISYEKEVTINTANAWTELSVDYSLIPSNALTVCNKLVFIFDLGTMGNGTADYTFLFDDISLTTAPVSTLTQMDLPTTFEGTTVDYGVIGFEGAESSSIVTDPTLSTNKVVKVIKSATAQPWAGTTVSAAAGLGFATNIPFTASNKKMNVRVWSPNAGIPVRLKVEDRSDATHSCETEATVTTASGWQTLEFDFANQATGTAAMNLAYNYNKASIFFNFGTNGATAGEKTYYFDDVKFGAAVLNTNVFDKTAIEMYPNPASHVLYLNAKEMIQSVEIFNALGQKVKAVSLNQMAAAVDVAGLEKGVYFLQAKTASASQAIRFVKE